MPSLRLVSGSLAVLALAGCASLPSDAAQMRRAYCDGVSTGGRLALAQAVTDQPLLLIRCDPASLDPAASAVPAVVAEQAPAPVAVLAEPVDPVT